MAVQMGYCAQIELVFNYKESANSKVVKTSIIPERISYVMIEHLYDNVNILPVIYLSINLSSDMYTKVVDTHTTSTFSLKISKRNKLIATSVYEEVVNDIFTYIPSSTTANYSASIDDENSYKNIMIGLVSSTATNLLRKSFNGIYKNTSLEALANKAFNGLPGLIKEDFKYTKTFDQLLITPCASRYAFLNFLNSKQPFYDTDFTFYMDFKNTYFISREGNKVDAKNGRPLSAVINIKNYNAEDAYTDGFTIKNSAYLLNVNAANTQVIVNNATDKVANNIVSYSDSNNTQNLNMNMNKAETSNTKTTYVRSINAAAIKNDYQSSSVIVSLLKQNIDCQMFNPNMAFTINHYEDYAKYNGIYYLQYKREFYNIADGGEFIVSCNVGLKRTTSEEVAKSAVDTSKENVYINSAKSSSSKNNSSKNSTKKASRKSN